MAGRPLWFVFAALFVIVLGRSHLFYWLGRGVFSGAAHLAEQAVHADARAAGSSGVDPQATGVRTLDVPPAGPVDAPAGRASALRTRAQRLLRTPAARHGLALVHRWGPLAVTAAYLTVGVQTAVFVGSGLLRMPYLRFTLASIPGSIAWALIWGTVGLGVVWGAVRLAATSPWGFAAAVAVVAGVVVAVLLRRARARGGSTGGAAGATEPEAPAA